MLPRPSDIFADLFMGEQSIDCVEVPTKLFFARHETVDRIVAIAAHANSRLHLLATEILFKPLVAMASARNQVMLRCPALWVSFAQAALFHYRRHRNVACEVSVTGVDHRSISKATQRVSFGVALLLRALVFGNPTRERGTGPRLIVPRLRFLKLRS